MFDNFNHIVYKPVLLSLPRENTSKNHTSVLSIKLRSLLMFKLRENTFYSFSPCV